MRFRPLLTALAILPVSLVAHADSISTPSSAGAGQTLTADLLSSVQGSTADIGSSALLATSEAPVFQSYSVSSPQFTRPPSGPVVPEPSSFVLLGTGLLGATGVIRRRLLR